MSLSKFRSMLDGSDSNRVLLRRLLTERAALYWKRYVAVLVLMCIAAGATALSAFLLGDVVNAAYVDRNMSSIVFFAVIVMVLFTIKAAATYFGQVTLQRIGNAIVATNQREMFRSLIGQNLGFFADRHSSEFSARLAAGANAATQAINLVVIAVSRDVFTLIGLVAVMVKQDPALSVVCLFILPPLMLLMRRLVRRVQTVARSLFSGNARILESMQETVQGIRIIKAYTLERSMHSKLEADVASYERELNKLARVMSRASPLMDVLAGIAVALGLVYGGYRVVETGSTPGEFFSFLAALMLAYEPAKRLARLNLELNNALVGVRILFEIIDAPKTEPLDEGKPALEMSGAKVEFSGVQFAYRTGEPVLRDMSFVAAPGQLTALVGPSGGGKSTVFNLILRFYDAQAGSVAIDGQDITQYSRQSLRQQIGYVGQDVYLFHGTVRENIAVGKPGATEDEIVAAAKAAHAHDFIMRFPDGYATQVGERGAQLSGGERQRIAIARALIREAKLILLDEATASLDSESERLVQDAMERLCRGRTTIAIAHRLHTITHADCILVVEGGAIVESGRHDELLRRDGRYAAFYRLQGTGQWSDPHSAAPA